MWEKLLDLSKTTEIVSEDTVEGVKGKVLNYDCDLDQATGVVIITPKKESVRK